jgi:polar amino acid transport system permease protein
MDFLIEYLPLILNGLLITLEVTIFGIFVGLALGIVLSIGDLYGGRIVSILIKFYVEFFRGSPIIIQLFMFYFIPPALFNIRMDGLTVGLLVFGLNSAGYQKGYIKGAMQAIFEDQMTAGLSIGMSKLQTIFYIILPQALRIVIPAWSNEFCSLTKSTAALGVIAVSDLTRAGQKIVSWSFRVLETWIFIAMIYLIWISIVTKIADIVYEKKKIPGIEISA